MKELLISVAFLSAQACATRIGQTGITGQLLFQGPRSSGPAAVSVLDSYGLPILDFAVGVKAMPVYPATVYPSTGNNVSAGPLDNIPSAAKGSATFGHC